MTMIEFADDRDGQIASERDEAAGLLRFAAPGVGISESGIGSVTCSFEVNINTSPCLFGSIVAPGCETPRTCYYVDGP